MIEDVYTCTRCGEDFASRDKTKRAVCYQCEPVSYTAETVSAAVRTFLGRLFEGDEVTISYAMDLVEGRVCVSSIANNELRFMGVRAPKEDES